MEKSIVFCSGLLEQLPKIEQQPFGYIAEECQDYWQKQILPWLQRLDSGCPRALLALAGHASKLRGESHLNAEDIPWKKYTKSIKVIRAAKQILAERAALRIARNENLSRPDSREKYLRAKKRYAIAVGQQYHQEHPLYRSQYAEVVYGRGGERNESWALTPNKYRKYGPTTWRNAGALWEGRYVVLEDYLGREVAKILVTKKTLHAIMRTVLNIAK